jgi:hypothetical protein
MPKGFIPEGSHFEMARKGNEFRKIELALWLVVEYYSVHIV